MKRENLNKEEYKELLEDLCREYCRPNQYCILKEFLVSLHPSPRLLLQLKCLERYKWSLGEEAKKDVGWKKATEEWVDMGYAKKFAEIYDEEEDSEDIKFAALYKKIMKNENGK